MPFQAQALAALSLGTRAGLAAKTSLSSGQLSPSTAALCQQTKPSWKAVKLVSRKHGQHWQTLWLVSSAAAGSPGCGGRSRAWAEENHTHHPLPAMQPITGGRWVKTSSYKPGETNAKGGDFFALCSVHSWSVPRARDVYVKHHSPRTQGVIHFHITRHSVM